MRDIVIAITAASYSGNKGAAAMLQSSIKQLYDHYGEQLNINLMSVYPSEDRKQLPFDFIQVIPSKPEQLLFIAFPLAILYWLFSWCPPIKRMLLKNKILKAYSQTDAVIDEAGISFVDSRGFVMNTYAFVCVAVPMLMGVPVMKYSQAMGTFKNPWNRFLAKWILPKVRLICARGKITLENLKEIGISQNVEVCADGAFSMEDSEKHEQMVESVCSEDLFYQSDSIVGVSISSVVEKKCKALGIDYVRIMTGFIEELNRLGYPVLLIANAARINSAKTRNNDLMICDQVYDELKNKDNVRWYHKEMDAEEIRAYIGRCRYLIASRFHAMIGALEKKVPVLLIGWSHKYKEVLDFFELGRYAIDFSNLTEEGIKKAFLSFVSDEIEIRKHINIHYDEVIRSSRKNIELILEEINRIIDSQKYQKQILDYNNPEKYIGSYQICRKGYASDASIRNKASSGGVVTALLCHALKTGKIDGALVTKTKFVDGKLTAHTHIATTENEIRDCSSSVYMDFPYMKSMDLIRDFNGKVAVVAVPCVIRSIEALMKHDSILDEKIVLKLGLYCSGCHDSKATELSMEKAGINTALADRLYFRNGHWRGRSVVINKDGTEQSFSYKKTICAYKNAYFFEKASCMVCQDHYAQNADISFGDIWLKSMKKNPIKHTCMVIRSDKAKEWYNEAVREGVICDSHISSRDILRGQKRALVFKFTCASAKEEYYARKGKRIQLVKENVNHWNHILAFHLAKLNDEFSKEHYDLLKRIPMWMIYYYMCFIRVLLSF